MTASVHAQYVIARGGYSEVLKGVLILKETGPKKVKVPVAIKRVKRRNEFNFYKHRYSQVNGSLESDHAYTGCGCFAWLPEAGKKILNDDKVMSFVQLETEIDILKELSGQSPYFLEFFMSRELKTRHWIVTELCVTNVKALVQLLPFSEMSKNYPIEIVKHISYPIISALAFLHERGILHRDIKEENILLTEVGVPKLIDFGTAKDKRIVFNKSQKKFNFAKELDYVGTETYLSPEIALGLDFDEKIDAFSFGLMLVSLVTGSTYARELSTDEVEDIFRTKSNTLIDFSVFKQAALGSALDESSGRVCHAEIKSIIEGLLNIDPKIRQSMVEVRDLSPVKEYNEVWDEFFRINTEQTPDISKEMESKLVDFNILAKQIVTRLDKYKKQYSRKVIS